MLSNIAGPATRLKDLATFTTALSEALTLERVVEVIVGHAVAFTGARAAILVHFDGAEPSLARLVSLGFEEGTSLERLYSSPTSPLVEVARTQLPIFIDARASRAVDAPRLDDGTLPQSFAFIPFVTRRRAIAGLALAFDSPASFDGEERAFIELVAAQSALAIERSKLYALEISTREQAEDENSRFRSLVHELDAIFWEADPVTFQFSFVSQRAEKILGYPVEAWKTPNFWASKIHPEDQHWAVDFCVQCTKDGQDHAFEYRMVAADGRTVWLRDVVYVLRDATGAPSLLRGVMVDVTRDHAAKNPIARLARRIIRRGGP